MATDCLLIETNVCLPSDHARKPKLSVRADAARG